MQRAEPMAALTQTNVAKLVVALGHDCKSSLAPFHRSVISSVAGWDCANPADCPAHACILSMSVALVRIAFVMLRWIGYGAGLGPCSAASV